MIRWPLRACEDRTPLLASQLSCNSSVLLRDLAAPIEKGRRPLNCSDVASVLDGSLFLVSLLNRRIHHFD